MEVIPVPNVASMALGKLMAPVRDGGTPTSYFTTFYFASTPQIEHAESLRRWSKEQHSESRATTAAPILTQKCSTTAARDHATSNARAPTSSTYRDRKRKLTRLYHVSWLSRGTQGEWMT